jgi:hypothetical protein
LLFSVIPAQAGIQGHEAVLTPLDARFRGHDVIKVRVHNVL